MIQKLRLALDTTKWELENGAKACIVFVTDNFSKTILGWNMSLSGKAQKDLQLSNASLFISNMKSSLKAIYSTLP